jgi:hypothetical protein
MAETAQEKLEALVARIKKVRRWLLALAILKAAGISMAFVSGYIGVYAWLDHHLNFGISSRITAFILLLAGSTFLLYKLARYLVTHISCSRAANFIETRHSFHQQLVAAIEFYEGQRDYPYSKALAEQLVLRVFKETEGFNFDSIINKWHGYVLAAIVLFGLGSVLFYARANYLYISSYFARLTRPLGTVQPLVSTSLQPITRDIVAEPNSPVTFAAEIEGLAPESGKLLLVAAEPNTTDNTTRPEQEEIRILPTLNEGEKAKLNASKSFAKTGVFSYRFEAGSASTEWHQVDIHPAPQIESMTADVLLPPRPPRNMRVKPYSEQIADQTLEVMPDSSITLSVQATGPLREATITGLDGQAVTKQVSPAHWPGYPRRQAGAKGGADQFTFSFTASRSGTIRFRLEDEFGLANENVPDLQVTVRNDEPPKITLISPEGDYITTDVASVPIMFEMSDDFGLNAAHIVLEIPRQPPKQLAIPIAEGEKTHTFTHTVELEQYDLRVSDSILFYAQASDIDTGSALPSRSSSSDVYFIEIRPYRQNWHPKPGGGQGSGAAGTAEDLLTILEYTRAILKKTWTIADKSTLSDEDRGRLKAINDDVQYCATQLTTMRDDSQYGFDEQAKTVLNQALQSYSRASEYLAGHNPIAALPPEKDAYGILRKFILELEMLWNPPSSGQSSPQEKPDSVKLQESPEFSPYEKERIEGQLKELQQKLEKVAREQKLLKTDFVNFLEQQTQQARPELVEREAGTQESKERTSSGAAQSKQSPAKASTSREGKSSSDQNAQEAKAATDGASSGDGQKPSQGAGPSSSPGQSGEGKPAQSEAEGKSDAEGGQPGQGGQPQAQLGDGPTTGKTSGSPIRGADRPAGTEARLRMIQAKQKALQEKVSQLKKDLEQLPSISQVQQAQAQQKAQEHLADALAKMDEFQAAVTAARHQPSVTPAKAGFRTGKTGPVGKAAEAVELMESARQKLDQAGNAIGQGLSMSEEQRLAEKAQEIAEQLAEDANALDESLTPLEKEEMLARLEAAKRLLDSMSGIQWSTVSKGSNRSSPVHVFTKDPRAAPAEAARALARQFWSIAIEAKKRKSHPFDKLRAGLIEDEPSDVKFYELENRFFENAAKFSLALSKVEGKEPVKK